MTALPIRLRPSLLLLAATCLPRIAAADPPEATAAVALPDVTVSATRRPARVVDVGSSVTVITGAEIAQKQRRTLPDVLRDVPGLSVVRTGGPGGQTSVFMRGANANQTKVRIDGIEVNDPSAPTGAFDFGPLLTAGIARVEVLRGPQSGLYGADAIGGVIDITTPRGEGPMQAGGSLEGGSFGTFNQSGYLRGSTGPFSYALDVGHVRATDTPTTPAALLPPGQRAQGNLFDATTLAARLGYQVTEAFDLGLVARLSDSTLRFIGDDNSVFPSRPAAEHSGSRQRLLVTRATGHLVMLDGVLEQTVGVGYTDYRRRDTEPAGGGFAAAATDSRGNRLKLDWRGDVRLGSLGTLILGAEHQREAITDSPVPASTRTDSGYAELIARYGRLSNTLSLRYDRSSRYRSSLTWRVAPALAFAETGTTLKASAGTGFKGPTLTQLFVSYPSLGFFANPNLKPEESIGYDLGVEQTLFGEAVRVGATYFHNAIDNLITANAAFTSYANVARASTRGVEAFAAWQASKGLKLRLDYTNTTAQNDVLRQELLRRPRTKVSVNAAWQATDRLFVSSTLLYVSSRIDGNRNFTVQRQRANGFFTADIAVDYAITDKVGVFGRVDNVLDRRYESPSGYLQPGIGAFGGVRFGL